MGNEKLNEFIEEFADALTDEDIIRSEAYAKGYVDGVKETLENTPKGQWIARPEHQGGFTPTGNAVHSCSECGWIFGAHMIYPDYKYCPMCGVRMVNLDD